MPALRRRLVASVTLALTVHASGWARADVAAPTKDDVARAEARFHAGEQLFDDNQFDAACAAFDESERLDPQLGTLLNLAFCEERIGKTATAWHEYNVCAVWAEQRGQHDRQTWALRRALEVGRKVSLVLFDVRAAVEGYTIEIDGSRVPPSEWGMPLSVDPGEHLVRVSVRGHGSQQLPLHVLEGPVTQTMVLPRLAVRTETVSTMSTEEVAPEEPARGGNGRLVLGLVGIGVGVAGAGVGTYFGVRTFSKKSDARGHCVGTECDATGVALQDDAHRSAMASTVAFAVGGASLGLGVWLTLTAPSSSTRAARRRIQPLIGPHMAGLGMGGTW
jgi:hypothetical protein